MPWLEPARELAAIACRLPGVETLRLRVGPKEVLGRARDLGASRRRRDEAGRRRLRRLIAFVDRYLPFGPSCYRRVALEIALDAGAAQETAFMGVRVGGGPRSGHVWLASEGEPLERYDASFEV